MNGVMGRDIADSQVIMGGLIATREKTMARVVAFEAQARHAAHAAIFKLFILTTSVITGSPPATEPITARPVLSAGH